MPGPLKAALICLSLLFALALGPRPALEAQTEAQPLEKKIFTPKYAHIGQAAAELQKLKSERGKIVAIGNDIYVEDKPEAIATMSQSFMRIDRVYRQILIEARIVEVDAAFIETLAADWGGGGPEPGRLAPGAGAAGQAEGKADQALLTYDFLSKKGTLYLDRAISDSESASSARTIAVPRVMAVNDQEVNIRQGRQHICGGTRMSRSSTMPKVEYKDPVMTFLVTPHVPEDNDQLVSLSLKIVNDEPQTGRPEEASAQLITKNGETVVIVGLALEGRESGEGKRMSLSDWLLPSRPNQRTELLIFLTATVIPLNI